MRSGTATAPAAPGRPAEGEEPTRGARALLEAGAALPSAAQMLDTLECGLLSWPYLEVWQGGAKAPHDEVFTSRTVQQKPVSGFVHYRNVRARYASGATLRFPAPEDWLAPLRPVVASLGASFGPDAAASLSLAGPGAAVQTPALAAAGALLVCSGDVTASSDDGGAGEDGEGGASSERIGERQLRHLPAGRTPRLTAGEDGVLLLVVAGGGRGAREFVRALQELARAHVADHPGTRRHHTMDSTAKAEWVRRELTAFFAAADPDELLRAVAGATGS